MNAQTWNYDGSQESIKKNEFQHRRLHLLRGNIRRSCCKMFSVTKQLVSKTVAETSQKVVYPKLARESDTLRSLISIDLFKIKTGIRSLV